MSELRRVWDDNASAWTTAVREQRIESRRTVTDAAIVSAVLDTQPRTVLDLGCGEGWLSRALAEHGIAVTGVDASLPLIASALTLGHARHAVGAYDALPFARAFDTIVANFSLLDDHVPALPPHRHFIVQTLHPATVDPPHTDGWRTATLDGWTDPMPWYFRTRESWLRVLRERYEVVEVVEPKWPDSDEPASVIFVCSPTPR
ncbi:MAG TPA: class I SAM-dependent methyltransferase [Thermoanaerobaculia bacterium]|nr:class I SAM-dependent methyltransferase [Thermoanaerobaculia bacterium]